MSPMTQQDVISTLIIGADVVARLGLRALLQVSDRVAIVGEAYDGREALAEAGRLGPDAVLLHTRSTCSAVVNDLHQLSRQAPVLLLADDESLPAVERALRAGATGYLINGQYSPDELVAAVLATAQEQPRLSPAAVGVLVRRLRTAHGYRDPARRPVLSRREVEIVEHLVRGRTNAEIGRALGISEKTVKNHVNHVYAKLHTRNRAETVARWLGSDPPHATG
jgi:DNA-binding NarL/FixJ family response regulator